MARESRRPSGKAGTEKQNTKPKPKPGIDWKALGYDDKDESYENSEEIKVDVGPSKFKVSYGKTYRIGFPFVAPKKTGGFDVRLKPVEHFKYYDEDTKDSIKFIMPHNEKLRKQIIDTFTTSPINTHYLTPIIVYDTNDEGKLLSRKEVSYSIKILAIPAGRYAKLKEASEQFSLADYDFHVKLDGEESTENYQKMNFTAVTVKKDLMSKTATWQKGTLVELPDDEDEDAEPVTMEEVIAECYERATDMTEVLKVREMPESKIKAILEEWSDVEDEEDDEDYSDEEEDDEADEDEESDEESDDPDDVEEDEEDESDEEYEEDDEAEEK